ncbi:MAG: acyl-CoA dehydrogenase family protein [Nanoarchaeota archaeon]|nr:acyl-CoA dehydrogenase family protein [Nanoarchaeota archaeon]MCG2717215.1 acyl-CoA dehydrogenase family protein [Nanoarchaeota archaeon]
MSFYKKGQKAIIESLYGSEYDDILNGCEKFVRKEIAPSAEKIDKEKISPGENLEKLAELGMIASHFPEKYGSLELPYLVHTAMLEMVSEACASTGVSMSIHNTVCEGLHLYGTEKQKDKYLTNLVTSGEIGSFCLTEPDSGTNILHDMKTTAKKDGKHYVLNGAKTFITNVGLSTLYVVFAKLDDEASIFLVEKGNKGMEFGKPFDKDTVRGSVTCEMFFDDCKIPEENMLGKKGHGAKGVMEMLNKGRVGIATLAVGIAQASLDKSLHYVKKRVVKGRPLSSFQLIQEKIANMTCKVDTARLITYQAAIASAKNDDYFDLLANECKWYASEAALECGLESRRIHAAYGCMMESNVERHLRDAWVTIIGEGTPEILKQTISRLKLKEHEKDPGLEFW